jgi:predicted nucleic acid-binding protein
VIVLDTNVLSELMRGVSGSIVERWVDRQAMSSLYVTSITQAEILQGVECLPRGKRRDALEAKAVVLFEGLFAGRVLAFGSDAAKSYAVIFAERRRLGRPLAGFDGLIAAIARVQGAAVATRNVDDFAHCEVELIDPWNDSSK